MYLPLLCYALLSGLSTFSIILTRKRELITLLLLSSCCIVTVSVLWLFLTIPLDGLQCVIVVFPGRTHLLFNIVCARRLFSPIEHYKNYI